MKLDRDPLCRAALGVAFALSLLACSDTDARFAPTEAFPRRDGRGCGLDATTACVTINDGAPAEERYTLLNVATRDGSGTYLFDGLGRIQNYWPTNGLDADPLPEPGRIIALQEPPGPITLRHVVRFRAPCVTIMNYAGAFLWPSEAPAGAVCGDAIRPIPYGLSDEGTPSALAHHEVGVWGAPVYWSPEQTETRGDGRVLFLSHKPLSEERSFPVTGGDQITDEPVVELAADGETILWEWVPADHIDEMGYGPAARDAIRTLQGAPEGNDGAPALPVPPDNGWLLLNAASYLGPNRHCEDSDDARCDLRFHPDNVLVSARQGALTFIVARHDAPDGRWSSGAIVWRLGPDFSETEYGPISGQHHAHMIPAGLPGAGNVLVLDNGSAAGFGAGPDGSLTSVLHNRGYSRVLEIDPVSLEIVWSYEQPTMAKDGTPRFFAFNLGSVQRLPDGNTLILDGNAGRLFEVDPAETIVWEMLSPFPPLAEFNLPGLMLTVKSYRGYRVPSSWVPRP